MALSCMDIYSLGPIAMGFLGLGLRVATADANQAFLRRLEFVLPRARWVSARFQLNAVKALAEAMLAQAPGLGSDAGVADLFHLRGISAKSVRDDARRSAVFLHDPF